LHTGGKEGPDSRSAGCTGKLKEKKILGGLLKGKPGGGRKEKNRGSRGETFSTGAISNTGKEKMGAGQTWGRRGGLRSQRDPSEETKESKK